jgi:hypothetical protein
MRSDLHLKGLELSFVVLELDLLLNIVRPGMVRDSSRVQEVDFLVVKTSLMVPVPNAVVQTPQLLAALVPI